MQPDAAESTVNDLDADAMEAQAPVNRAPLAVRRPAETAELSAGVALLGAYLGLDLPEEVVIAVIVLLAGLPAFVTSIVDVWRDAARDIAE